MLEDRRVLASLFNYSQQQSLSGLGVTTQGTARLVADAGSNDSWIQLTGAGSHQLGSFFIQSQSPADATSGHRSFTAQFAYSIKEGSTPPADGLSFGYGPISSAFGEDGSGSGVWLSINTFVDAPPSLRVLQGTTPRLTVSLDSSALRGNWIPVTFTVNSGGLVTVTHPAIGTRTAQLSSWNPQPNWTFGMGARTGQYFDQHVVEWLAVTDNNSAPTISTTVGGTCTSTSCTVTDAASRSAAWAVSDPDGDSLGPVSAVLRKGTTQISTSSSANSSLNIPFQSQGLGQYTLNVTAKDTQAAQATPRTVTITVNDDDATAPSVGLSGSPNGTQYWADNQRWNWSIQDASGTSSTVTVKKNGAVMDWIPNPFPRTYTTTGSTITSDSFDFNEYGLGSYEITIKATDADTDRGSVDQSETIVSRIVNVLNTPPVALFTTAPASNFEEGAEIIFDASASYDPDGLVLKNYVWNFGDGTLAQGMTVKHRYRDNGSYVVKLTVVDSLDDRDASTQKPVSVANIAPSLNVTAPQSIIEAAPFKLGLMLLDPGSDNASINVDWGDGNVETFSSAGDKEHVYATGGQTHTIRISLQDEDGIYANQFVRTYTVADAAPVVQGFPEFITGQAAVLQAFGVTVTDGAADSQHYSWDFGDNTSASGPGLNNVSHAYAANGTYILSLTVTDSDGLSTVKTAPVTIGAPVSFTVDNQAIAEDGGSLTISARLDDGIALDHDVVIPLVTTGEAAMADIQLTAAQLVIAQGQLTGSVTVLVKEDVLDEDDEELIVALGLPVGASLGAIKEQRIQILDNDARPSVFFTTTSQTVDESTGSVMLTASLSAVSGRDVIVPLSFSGTAVAGSDYHALTPSELIIPAGSLSASQPFRLIDDVSIEPAETILVQMLASGQAELSTELARPTSLALIIAANDSPSVTFGAAYRMTAEGVPAIDIRAWLSDFTDQTISVPFTVSGTATNGLDYGVVASNQLVFPPGSFTTTKTVLIHDDNIQEDIQNFVLQLQPTANVMLGVTQLTLTDILDNDRVQVSFEPGELTPFEGSTNVPIKVKLSQPSETAVTVAINVSGSALLGEDYSLSTTQVTFTVPTGETQTPTEATVYMSLTDDAVNEPPKTIYLTIQSVSGGIGGSYVTKPITIRDNDPLVSLVRTSAQSTFSEADGQAELAVELSAISNLPVTVPIHYSGSATHGTDYTGTTSVTVPAGQQSTKFTITSIDDSLAEDSSRIDAVLGTPVNGLLSANTSVALAIADDDQPAPNVFWDLSSYTADENNARADVKIVLSHPVPYPVTVDLTYGYSGIAIPLTVLGKTMTLSSAAKENVDFLAQTRSVTIPANASHYQLLVPLLNDDVKEGSESFSITLSSATNGILPVDESQKRTNVVITDTDQKTLAEVAQELAQQTNESTLQQIENFRHDNDAAIDSVINLLTQIGGSKAVTYFGGGPLAAYLVHIGIFITNELRDRYPDGHGWINGNDLAEASKTNEFWDDMGKAILNETARYFGGNILSDLLSGTTLSDVLTSFGETIGLEKVGVDALGDYTGQILVGAYEAVVDSGCCDVPAVSTKSLYGYVHGATLFLDTDFDGVRSASEPYFQAAADGSVLLSGLESADTNQNGVLDFAEGQWVAIGGIDTSRNTPTRYALTAPANYSVVSPSSTLVSKLLETGAFERTGSGIRSADARYLSALGLEDVPLAHNDFIRRAAGGDLQAAALFGSDTALDNVVVMTATLFDARSESLSLPFLASIVLEDIADKIAEPISSLELTNPSVIRGIIQGVSVRTGISLDATLLSEVSSVIARANALIAQEPLAGSRDYLDAVVKIQTVAQGSISDSISQFALGSMSLTAFKNATSDASFNSMVANAQAFNVLPVYLAVFDAAVVEGNNGTTMLEFLVAPLGKSALPISVNFHTSDGNAVDGQDYVGVTGSLSWEAGDSTAKSIQVMVLGDSDSEADELLSLYLENPTNATFFRGIGLGKIANDDQFLHETSPGVASQVSVSIDNSNVTVQDGHATLLQGSYELGANLNLVGHPNDRLQLFASSPDVIRQTVELSGNRFIEIDGHEIDVSGFGTIEDELTAAIAGFPAYLFAEKPFELSAVIPGLLNTGSTVFQWRVLPAHNNTPTAIASGPEFTYSPAEGDEWVELSLSDGVRTTTLRQQIFVYPNNVAPVAMPDWAEMTENSVAVVDVVANDADLNPEDTSTLVSGSVVVVSMSRSDGSPIAASTSTVNQTTKSITFNPGSDFDFLAVGERATVIIDYGVVDNGRGLLSDGGQLTIEITGINDNSAAADDNVTSAGDDQPITIDVLVNDLDPDTSDVLVVSGFTQPTNGTVVLNPEGTFTYTPGVSTEFTIDSFTYTISDGHGGTSVGTVKIHIEPYSGVSSESGILRVSGTGGPDSITASGSSLLVNGVAYALTGVTEVRIWGRAGNDQIDLSGLSVPAFVHGGDGHDILTGGNADDILFGGVGDDSVVGLSGNDVLVGGDGKNRLVGSTGHDILVSSEVAPWLSLWDVRKMSRDWKNSQTITEQAVDDFIEAQYGDEYSDLLTGSAGADLFIITKDAKVTDFRFDKPKTNQDGDVVIVDGVAVT